MLSVYNGDDITAKDAFTHYTTTLGLDSCGVLAITQDECNDCCLPVRSDPAPFKEHCVIDFTEMSDSQRRKKSGILRNYANARGWLYKDLQ